MASEKLQHLLRVLDERGIALGHDDIAWAFESSKTAEEAAVWVQEYLSPHNLLTRDELYFYEKKGKSAAKTDPTRTTGRPLTDTDFEAAISSLEASTAAIEKQCQIFEAQKQALVDLKARHNGEVGESHAQSQQKRLAREKAQLDFDISELSDALGSRLQPHVRQCDAATSGLSLSIGRALEKDDRLLHGLQRLLPSLEDGKIGGDGTPDVEQLCQALIALSSAEIRARIDAAFCQGSQSTHDGQPNGRGDDAHAYDQRESLRAELEELSTEIDGLIAMAVENQYRAPILRDMKSANAESEHEKAQWSEYVLLTLQYMTARLEAIGSHCQHLHVHQGAVKQVSSALDGIIAAPTKSKRDAQQAAPSPSTPIAKGLKPLRLVQANFAEPQDPAVQLLRHFDIRMHDPSDTAKLLEVLERAEKERRARLADLATSTEQSVSDQLAETLVRADADVQDLLGAVFAHSKFGTVKLIDEEVRAAVDGLEEKTQSLGEEMRKLDVDEIGSVVKMKQRKLAE